MRITAACGLRCFSIVRLCCYFSFNMTSAHTSKALLALNKVLHIMWKNAFEIYRFMLHTVVRSKDEQNYRRGNVVGGEKKRMCFLIFFSLCRCCFCFLSNVSLFLLQSVFSPTCFSYASQYVSRYESQGEGRTAEMSHCPQKKSLQSV